jgi:hypothetical protein
LGVYGSLYRDKKVVGVFVLRLRAPLHLPHLCSGRFWTTGWFLLESLFHRTMTTGGPMAAVISSLPETGGNDSGNVIEKRS